MWKHEHTHSCADSQTSKFVTDESCDWIIWDQCVLSLSFSLTKTGKISPSWLASYKVLMKTTWKSYSRMIFFPQRKNLIELGKVSVHITQLIFFIQKYIPSHSLPCTVSCCSPHRLRLTFSLSSCSLSILRCLGLDGSGSKWHEFCPGPLLGLED